MKASKEKVQEATPKNPVRVFFVKKKVGKPSVMTVATEVINKDVRIAFAYCSHKDRFSRKMGRRIALNRLQTATKQRSVPTSIGDFAFVGFYESYQKRIHHVLQMPFSGHSGKDLVKAWRRWEHYYAPTIWKGVKLTNTKRSGLVARA